MNRWQLALLTIVLGTATALGAQPDLEELRRKAVDLLDRKQYPEAEKAFFSLLARDVKAPTAPYAVEQLKRIQLETQAVEASVERYAKLKATGVIREPPFIDPARLEVFKTLKEPGKLEERLGGLFKLVGLLAARTTLLSVLLEAGGRLQEAVYYYEAGTEEAKRREQAAYETHREHLRLRPLYHERPRHYRDLEVPLRSRAEVEALGFQGEQLEAEALQLSRQVEGIHPTLALAFSAGYDTHTTEAAQASGGIEQGLLAHLGAEGGLEDALSYGFGYDFSARMHPRTELRARDSFSHLLGAWASWWDRKSIEVRLRYDLASTRHNPEHEEVVPSRFGPQLGVSALIAGRHRLDLLYTWHRKLDPNGPASGDGRRAGTEHELRLQLSFLPGKARLQPFVHYALTRNLAEGGSFNALEHSIGLGTSTLLGERAAIRLSTRLSFRSFPESGGARPLEQSRWVGVDGGFPLTAGEWLMLTGGAAYRSRVTSLSSREASGLELTLGFASALKL